MGIGERSFTRAPSLSGLAPRSFEFRKVVARFGPGVREEGRKEREKFRRIGTPFCSHTSETRDTFLHDARK